MAASFPGSVCSPTPLYPARIRPGRISTADQIAALEWQETVAEFGYGPALLVHRSPDGTPMDGDVLSIWRAGETRPFRFLLRSGRRFVVSSWNTGAQLGSYPTIRQALDAIFHPAMQSGAAA